MMKMRKRLKQALPIEHSRLLSAYQQLVSSVREARSVQPALERERQMRRLMHYMRSADYVKP